MPSTEPLGAAKQASALGAINERKFIMPRKQVFGSSHVPLSLAVRAGDFVYVSGQVPVGPDGRVVQGGIEVQTAQVLDNIKSALALAGASMADVVKTTVWIEDARDFGGMNKVYATYFANEPPARTTVESRLMIDIKVEIEAVAYAPVK
jgi:2-iminobutanoate/2-iminopropanoate deaminase